jgi:hypothetical protein
MFFQPQRQALVVPAMHQGRTVHFRDAQKTLLFIYSRPECTTMHWNVKSAWLPSVATKVTPKWWSLDNDDQIVDDLPKQDILSFPIYTPTVTFRGQEFTNALTRATGELEPADRDLYRAILGSGSVQLNVLVNNELIVPLLLDLDYRSVCA